MLKHELIADRKLHLLLYTKAEQVSLLDIVSIKEFTIIITQFEQ